MEILFLFAMKMFRDFQIKTWIIDENDGIGLPRGDVALAERQIAQNRGQMEQHGNEAHIGQLAIMFHERSADGLHLFATEKAEFRCCVFLLDGPHQVRCVQIARGFTDYQVIFHDLTNLQFDNLQAPL